MTLWKNPQKTKNEPVCVRNEIIRDKRDSYSRAKRNFEFLKEDFSKVKSKNRNYKKNRKKISKHIFDPKSKPLLTYCSVVLLYAIYWRLSIQKFKKWGKLRHYEEILTGRQNPLLQPYCEKGKGKVWEWKVIVRSNEKLVGLSGTKVKFSGKTKKSFLFKKIFAKNQNLSQQVDMNEIVKSQK